MELNHNDDDGAAAAEDISLQLSASLPTATVFCIGRYNHNDEKEEEEVDELPMQWMNCRCRD